MQGLKIYLDDELAEELRSRADAEGRTITGLVRMLVRDYLRKPPGPAGYPQEATAGPDENGA